MNPEELSMDHSSLARERVFADLRALSRDAEDLLRATAGDMSEKAKEARAKIAEALERARTTCDSFQEKSAANARVAAQKADTVIRAHPYESIGIAFGLGLLIGVLVNRK